MDSNHELKPCPFCGGDACVEHNEQQWFWIECASCCASTNMRVSSMDDCIPLLAEQWNRRIPPEPAAVRRECQCGWAGPESECRMCGSVGPLCPECGETTEVWPLPPEPASVPDGWRPVPIIHLQNILCLIDPEPVRLPNGKSMVFKNPNAAEALTRISAEVRAMLAAAPQTDQRQNRRPALLVYSTPGSEWRIPSEPEKLSNPVRVGGVNFHKGVSVDRVIRHAERQYELWKEARDSAPPVEPSDGAIYEVVSRRANPAAHEHAIKIADRMRQAEQNNLTDELDATIDAQRGQQ